jgi:hypothetical protein
MSTPSPEQLMYRIVGKAEETNARALALLDDGPGFFEAVSQHMPKFVPAELGFLRLVSWLYVLFWEAGKISVPFVMKRFEAYSVDADGRIRAHPINVQELRTYTQHNLNNEEAHDKLTMGNCHTWFSSQCGTAVPDSEDEWSRCVLALLQESIEFLEALLNVLRFIERDESKDVICKEWKFRRNRYHPPHQFEALVSSIASDMGHEYIDSERLVRRNYDKWTQSLRAFSSEYVFEVEARKLIENAILADLMTSMPITGEDVIREFNLEPGKLVGRLLGDARELYQRAPCSRTELIDQLRPIAATLFGK